MQARRIRRCNRAVEICRRALSRSASQEATTTPTTPPAATAVAASGRGSSRGSGQASWGYRKTYAQRHPSSRTTPPGHCGMGARAVPTGLPADFDRYFRRLARRWIPSHFGEVLSSVALKMDSSPFRRGTFASSRVEPFATTSSPAPCSLARYGPQSHLSVGSDLHVRGTSGSTQPFSRLAQLRAILWPDALACVHTS